MFELFISKGIIPQTKPLPQGNKKRSNSEVKKHAGLETQEQVDEKIQKEMIKAKHLGPLGGAKPNLLTGIESKIKPVNLNPNMSLKQNNLASNFSELTGSTSFIDKKEFDKSKTIMQVSVLSLTYSSPNF